jgi:hypothetical protein
MCLVGRCTLDETFDQRMAPITRRRVIRDCGAIGL